DKVRDADWRRLGGQVLKEILVGSQPQAFAKTSRRLKPHSLQRCGCAARADVSQWSTLSRNQLGSAERRNQIPLKSRCTLRLSTCLNLRREVKGETKMNSKLKALCLTGSLALSLFV